MLSRLLLVVLGIVGISPTIGGEVRAEAVGVWRPFVSSYSTVSWEYFRLFGLSRSLSVSEAGSVWSQL